MPNTPPRGDAGQTPSPNGGGENPFSPQVHELGAGSAIAFVGHPLHALMVHFPIALAIAVLGLDLLYWLLGDPFFERAAVWAAGGAFLSGVVAAVIGLAEVLLVPGIRLRVASWTHATAAMLFLAVIGANWGLRLEGTLPVLPNGLLLSFLGTFAVGAAGFHGGSLIFHHGIGLMVPED